MEASDSSVVIFKTENEKISVKTRFDEEIVGLTLDQVVVLFERDKSAIACHIKNVFDKGGLDKLAIVANFTTVRMEGTRQIERKMDYFNLDYVELQALEEHVITMTIWARGAG
jgi:hypothetical protein